MISTANTMYDTMLSMDNFGTWLLKELEQRDMSQSDLAKLSGLSRGTLSNLISGTRGIGTDSIEAIARALRLPPETVYRAAGLLPSQPEADEMVEKLNYKITQLTPGARALAEKLLDALLEEDVKKVAPVGKTVKSAR